MSKWKNQFKNWVQNDWVVSFFILLVFLAIKGYKYGWDDQHLEIPLLKGLIDSALYQGDYYVEALKANFPGYFYSLLARCITVKQIPAAYFILYLISKYFLFFFAYKLWYFIAKRKSVAVIYMAVFMMFGRVPEFLYRTFSHQEFTIAIIMAGIYYFYTERFVLAAIILGIGANFHLIYALFPMIYLASYLLLHMKRHGFKILAKTALGFLLCASPIIFSIIQKRFVSNWGNPADSFVDWVTLYKLGCPQNFIFYGVTLKYALTKFAAWFSVVQEYIFLIALFVLNIIFNEKFKKDGKAHAVSLAALILFVLSYVFTYFIPTRLVLDMNLVRNVQFLFFIFLGYTTLLIVSTIDDEKTPLGYGAAILFSCLALNNQIGLLAAGALMCLLTPKLIANIRAPYLKTPLKFLSYAGLCACLFFIAKLTWDSEKLAKTVILAMTASTTGVYIFTLLKKQPHNLFLIKRLFVLLPLIAILAYHVHSHVTHVTAETKGGGFWKLQRDWEDMQHFVRNNTPKNAVFLVPNDMEMGGFRIYSERPIICCYRDCGIVGFDYQAAVEWLKRLHDIEPFKVVLDANSDIKPAMMTAILKYKVSYIVFMRYYAPSGSIPNLYDKIYENDSFSLFKVPLNSR